MTFMLNQMFWIIVVVCVWFLTRSHTTKIVRRRLSKHEHVYDTVTIEDLPSEWEGMIASLKYTKKQADELAARYDKEELAKLTQPRVLVRATCACANTRVVLVYGKEAIPMKGSVADITPMLQT